MSVNMIAANLRPLSGNDAAWNGKAIQKPSSRQTVMSLAVDSWLTAPVNPDERFCDLVIARLKTGTAMAVITIPTSPG
jgi:hypothetical protein